MEVIIKSQSTWLEEWSDLLYRSYNNLDMSYHIIYILWNMNQYMNIRIDMRPSTPKDEGSIVKSNTVRCECDIEASNWYCIDIYLKYNYMVHTTYKRVEGDERWVIV